KRQSFFSLFLCLLLVCIASIAIQAQATLQPGDLLVSLPYNEPIGEDFFYGAMTLLRPKGDGTAKPYAFAIDRGGGTPFSSMTFAQDGSLFCAEFLGPDISVLDGITGLSTGIGSFWTNDAYLGYGPSAVAVGPDGAVYTAVKYIAGSLARILK